MNILEERETVSRGQLADQGGNVVTESVGVAQLEDRELVRLFSARPRLTECLDLPPAAPRVILTVVVCPVVLVTGPDHDTVLATTVRLPPAPVCPVRRGPGVLPGVLAVVGPVCQTNPVVGTLTEISSPVRRGPGRLSVCQPHLSQVSRNCCSAAELISAR